MAERAKEGGGAEGRSGSRTPSPSLAQFCHTWSGMCRFALILYMGVEESAETTLRKVRVEMDPNGPKICCSTCNVRFGAHRR